MSLQVMWVLLLYFSHVAKLSRTNAKILCIKRKFYNVIPECVLLTMTKPTYVLPFGAYVTLQGTPISPLGMTLDFLLFFTKKELCICDSLLID